MISVFRKRIRPVRTITEDVSQLEVIYKDIVKKSKNFQSPKGIFHKSSKDPYFVEDYVRVYPDGMVFDICGNKRQPTKHDINNFLNHCKFYTFAAQFVKDRYVADVGCGSGYGCAILKKSGTLKVCGSDLSEHAINFAKSRYSDFAEFTIQSITDLKEYHDDSFDITISSEVLEHIKEHGMEERAINELKRITRNGGLIIIGTPNSELLGDHGFSFDKINALFQKKFSQFCIFENALVPFGHNKLLWEKRLSEDKVGVIISQYINLSETVLPDGITPEIKKGIEPGRFKFASYDIDTTLLHNTHSWIILAINNK
jgi:2-polyprenyl-3-methyl-5-hydroxy-6-metoxy-1,4-benzoquinol methylase